MKVLTSLVGSSLIKYKIQLNVLITIDIGNLKYDLNKRKLLYLTP